MPSHFAPSWFDLHIISLYICGADFLMMWSYLQSSLLWWLTNSIFLSCMIDALVLLCWDMQKPGSYMVFHSPAHSCREQLTFHCWRARRKNKCQELTFPSQRFSSERKVFHRESRERSKGELWSGCKQEMHYMLSIVANLRSVQCQTDRFRN